MPRKKTVTRRGNNEGSISQRPDGRWIAQVTLGYDNNGKRIRRTFYGQTRSEVAVKMTTEINNGLKGGHASLQNDPLEILMTEWLLTFKKAMVTPRTFERAMCTSKKHIYPNIGNLKLEEVTPPVIQRLFNNMSMQGYALASIKKVKFLLNQFFEYAVESQFLDHNPVHKTKLLSRERKTVTEDEYKAIPVELRSKFLELLEKSPILKPICITSMYAGLRIGEVLALKWKNLDFENCVIRVENAVTQVPTFDKKGKTLSRKTVISDTKTAASVREVPMPDILIVALKEWKDSQVLQEIRKDKSFTADSDLVFSNNNGELRTYWGTRAMFDRLLKENGMGNYGFHFHSLRHTYSSMLFEARVNPKVIQMLLGHKDVTTTIKTYNSIDRSYFKQATNVLNQSTPCM